MKNILFMILFSSIVSCVPNQNKEETIDENDSIRTKNAEKKETELIIGERIDGPANIRNEPNGEVLFELKDNALVEVSSKPENDWYEILVYTDIDYNEFGMDSILKDRFLIATNDTIGKVLKSHYVSTGRGGKDAFAMLHGYTFKDNIKPETIIETVFIKNLEEKGRDFMGWERFIDNFQLDDDAVGYDKFNSFYNYENAVDDPSPGFRIVLLFENQSLVGFIHSREIQIMNIKTHKLNWSYYVSFFQDFPINEQIEFVDYMNEWIVGVD